MEIIQKLRNQGYRITKPREEVLNVLRDYPHTVQELFGELKARGSKADLASVYRTLELLVKMDIIQVIEFGEGKKRYEIVNEAHHHHHLVCNSCGSIKDIEVNEELIMAEVSAKANFKIQKHIMEFFGLCNNCQ